VSATLTLPADGALGVFGGAFDPVHNGHLAIARAAQAHFALGEVRFVPTGEAPHKPAGQASAEDRYRMTVLATAGEAGFTVSRIEIDRPGRSYMVDTLRALAAQEPGRALVLILGADMALDFPTWRDPQGIRALATVAAAARPGVADDRWRAACTAAGIVPFPMPPVAISSTALRAAVAAGAPISDRVPAAVAAYIREHRLYAAYPNA
jgi:nicotinate-nucleotide adenylyltransferase